MRRIACGAQTYRSQVSYCIINAEWNPFANRVQEALWRSRWMDQEPVKIYAVEEMEESTQVSADYDQFWFQAPRRSSGLDQNEQMAVGSPQGGPLRYEPQMVQKAGPEYTFF